MNRYIIGLFGITIAWGLAFTLIKTATLLVGLWPFFAIRFWIASVIIGIAFHKSVFKWKPGRIKAAFIMGGLLFTHLWLQTLGLQTISAGRSGFITSFYVPITPLFYWLLSGRRPTGRQMILVALATFGLVVLSVPPDFNLAGWLAQSRIGDFWTLCAACVAVLHIVYTGKFAQADSDPVALGFWQFIFIACFFTAGTFLGDASHPDQVVLSLSFWNWPAVAVVNVLICALFATSFAFIMQIVGQRYVDSVKAAIIYGLEAPFATLGGVVLAGERMLPHEIGGALLLFIASVIPERQQQVQPAVEKGG